MDGRGEGVDGGGGVSGGWRGGEWRMEEREWMVEER